MIQIRKKNIIFICFSFFFALLILIFLVRLSKFSLPSNLTGQYYCSMANGCPGDKCYVSASCLGDDGETLGCRIGSESCEWKDSQARENYKEVSLKQAEKCVRDFFIDNSKEYPYLKQLEVYGSYTQDTSEGASRCTFPLIHEARDPYCWLVQYRSKIDPLPNSSRGGLEKDVWVGAESCVPYFDLTPPILKLDDPTLQVNQISYSPEQAIDCAKQYVKNHQDEFEPYKNIYWDTFKIYGKEPVIAPSHDIPKEAYLKDWNFYIIGAKTVAFLGKYKYKHEKVLEIDVGAHTCSSYGVSENWFDKDWWWSSGGLN